LIHPIDYRYKVDELEDYIAPNALMRYQLRVEIAYIEALSNAGVCSNIVFKEYEEAEKRVKLDRVLELEKTLKHDVRSMVEALREQVSPEAKPYCHLGLTSYDIVVNANALIIRDVTTNLILPALKGLITRLINIARETRDVVQIGRTHGQHAEPTTFGYVIANYIERIGRGYQLIQDAQSRFRGKIAGAVGTKAAIDIIGDARKIEADTLAVLKLPRVEAPSQIANQEELANYYSQLVILLGTLSDLANDFRQLQRTEISEVFEQTNDHQVGSSTMPQKRNPIGWENIISHYKTIIPRLITSYLNIISEHQRDLTDSAANRYLLAEMLNTFLYCVIRATHLLERLGIDSKRMRENILTNDFLELAEPAYIILSLHGEENAYDLVRGLAREARDTGKSFKELLHRNESFRKQLESFTTAQKEVFEDSSKYIGGASEITESVCGLWEGVLEESKND